MTPVSQKAPLDMDQVRVDPNWALRIPATLALRRLVLPFAAIVITGVVLIQGYRDTTAIHAKLDEIVIALEKTRNDVVGLEHANPKEIEKELERIEKKAAE